MKKIVFFDIDDVLFNTALFIDSEFKVFKAYEDAKEVLEKIRKDADVAILSKGEYNLQLTKLKESNLISFFEKESIFVVEEKNEAVRDIFATFKDKDIFMVDDRLNTLWEIKKNNPSVKTVWIKRGRHTNIACEYKPDYSIDSLSQLLELI